ncbi:flagellar assembly peptidoglycan hydrolase FlgJ [Pseudaeromonas sp. ZJS20]|uniref:flagellar assembly peptidoglycan hydrolase FlgJ n=1 Tax=Pseudaeromonas aegiceratis TaxID=3153928 RepID=UPI00390C9D9E
MDKFTQTGVVDDIRSLDRLRQLSTQGKASQQQALEAAARQFESLFTQMWMKGMRQANSVLTKDSPLNSRYTEFYQGMLDQQMSASLSPADGKTGLAAMLVRQLSGNQSQASTPDAARQLKMPEGRLPVMRRIDTTASSDSQNVGTDSAELSTASGAVVAQGLESRRTRFRHHAGITRAERFVQRLDSQGTSRQRGQQFDSPQEFVRQLLPVARQVAAKVGLSPEALVAQAALETGWGKHVMPGADGESSRNLFGIKAGSRWQGLQTQVRSLEYEDGKPVMRMSQFRSYNSYAQSMKDYVELIGRHPRYEKARAVAQDPEAYFEALQDAGYATDPHYARKLKQVLRSEAFDQARQEMET